MAENGGGAGTGGSIAPINRLSQSMVSGSDINQLSPMAIGGGGGGGNSSSSSGGDPESSINSSGNHNG